jgi:molecular chaperone DnaK (HSP70)
MIDFNKYLKDDNQTNLNLETLSNTDKLKMYRQILYNDLIIKLNDLTNKRKQLIEDYKINVKNIDGVNKNEN